MLLPLLLALAPVTGQVTPTQPMPRGTALPPPGTEEGAVIAPIVRLFAAMAARDGAAILAQVRPDGRVTGVAQPADPARPVRSGGWADFAAQFKPGEGPLLEERLTGTPAVEIDGDIAMVWASYEFRIDGKFSHCGTDHFDMVRDGGGWRILNITWTRRTTGCTAQ